MEEVATEGPVARHALRDNGATNGMTRQVEALKRQNATLLSSGINDETGARRTSLPSGQRSRSKYHSNTTERKSDYSRGTSFPSSSKVLFDPSKSMPPRRPEAIDSEREREREGGREKLKKRAPEFGRGESSSGKQLFDPTLHDPRSFAPRLSPASNPELSNVSPKMIFRRPAPSSGDGYGIGAGDSLSSDIDGDRERERRKRREGSERGSTLSGKKKDGDTKSKGSRSSEGSESLKDRERGKGRNGTGVKPILKKIHDDIKDLEQELVEIHRRMSQNPDASISVLSNGKVDAFSRTLDSTSDNVAAWVKLIAKHKQLADFHDRFLATLYDPLVPSSYHQLSIKYNIPSRLWQTAFFLILEQLRHAWISNQPSALDLLTDVVYDAYRFYSELLENQALGGLRGAWIEALGDLARYRMTIAFHVSGLEARRDRIKRKSRAEVLEGDDGKSVLSGASIGAEVAQHWDVEDKETWRVTATEWYTMGITEKPGEGRLHHHLALLCRDVKGREGKALHHFVKSMVVTHEYSISRENILPLFDSALQSQRSLPEATALDLFVRLHGMLFTKISLDSFPSVQSRFMERLEEDASLDGISRKATIGQVDWMIMGVVNLAGILQYGASNGLIRKSLAQEGIERRRAQAHAIDEVDEEGIDGERHEELLGDEPFPQLESGIPPITYIQSLSLAFSVFSFVLAHPNRIQGFYQVLNPYITIFLTFLATMFRQPHVGFHLLSYVPWQLLADFTNAANIELVEEKKLANGAPLPEDWLIRGSEWVGRRVYERGFWKGKQTSGRGSFGLTQPQPHSGERFQSEMDVLEANFDSFVNIHEGVVDEIEGTDTTDGPTAVNQRRWKRVAWAVGVMAKSVDGFEIKNGQVIVEGALKEKIERWEQENLAQERQEKETLERKRQEREREELELSLEVQTMEEGQDEEDLAVLVKRLQDLKALASAPTAMSRKARKAANVQKLDAIPGYTMLIFDTNVVLDSLEMLDGIVQGGQWTIVVPLPVVTELDGLSKDPLVGSSARAAVAFLEQRIRTHALCLKIQTTRGNYLSDLLIRTEQRDDIGNASFARTMDDRIVDIAVFARDHFMDRTTLLGMPKPEGQAIRALLVSNDRNMRLKAQAEGVDVASERELMALLARYKS
ncbi:uncharacterized protein L203_103582 [Cryptococcus depauperatus CBS 7841]|uniref:Uncharacterized protein n=1 Tax=Cryptococcus depauperatus CBS 7841 TaxID=1295531 RepID=A0A1E3IHZ0_9TREE|nr:hypothetical protein L203_02821 [Cryptococcus depauperatus CBS 7841]